MKRLSVFLLAAFAWVSTASAIPTTSPFKDVDRVMEDLAQDVYRAWRLRISELPTNYQQIVTPGGIEYRSPNKEGCSSKNASSLLQPVASISFASQLVSPNELRERVTYRGCDGEILLTEILLARGTNLSPSLGDDILVGKRRFIHAANETERVSTFVDPVLGPIYTILSGAVGPQETATRFNVMGTPLVTFRRKDAGGTKLSRIDVENYDMKISKFGGSFRSRNGSAKSHFVVIDDGSTINFKFDDELEFTSQQRFEELYSERVVENMGYTAKELLSVYLSRFPKTEVAKPASGANQRIKEELSQAVTRLVQKKEVERVLLLLQSLLAYIDSGELAIEDNRPK